MAQELHPEARRLLALLIEFPPLASERLKGLLPVAEPVETLSVKLSFEFPDLLFHLGNAGLHFSHSRENRLLIAG
jgi:hypothetical protein